MYKGWNEFPFSFRPLTVFVKYIYADTHTPLPKMFPFTLIVLPIRPTIRGTKPIRSASTWRGNRAEATTRRSIIRSGVPGSSGVFANFVGRVVTRVSRLSAWNFSGVAHPRPGWHSATPAATCCFQSWRSSRFLFRDRPAELSRLALAPARSSSTPVRSLSGWQSGFFLSLSAAASRLFPSFQERQNALRLRLVRVYVLLVSRRPDASHSVAPFWSPRPRRTVADAYAAFSSTHTAAARPPTSQLSRAQAFLVPALPSSLSSFFLRSRVPYTTFQRRGGGTRCFLAGSNSRRLPPLPTTDALIRCFSMQKSAVSFDIASYLFSNYSGTGIRAKSA